MLLEQFVNQHILETMSKTRVDATKDKIELLQEMQGMINTLKNYASRIQERINVMIEADLESMDAEKEAIDEMKELIKSNGK